MDFFVIYVILLLAILCFILYGQNKLFGVLGLWILFLALGIWRYQTSIPARTLDEISYYNGQPVEFIGLVNKEPDQREDQVKLEIKSRQLIVGAQKLNVSGKVLVTNSLFPQYQYGDQLQISCDLKEPEPIEDFNYDQYLSRYDIYSLCYSPKITLLAQNRGSIFLSQIYKVKNFFLTRINRTLPEPQSSFLGGLLIGAKKAIPIDLQTYFNKTGTTHIVAVSGYNITIIVAFLMLMAANLGLGRKKVIWLILGFLAIFLVITGLQASILRAALMGTVVLMAGYLGRRGKVANVLVLAAVLMLIFNPKILVYDLGFQLSFLATLGLVYLNPVLSVWLKTEKIKNKFLKTILGDYLLTTLSAIIMTQPLILYQFGKISLIAPLANILVLPFIPIAMMLGFITGLAAMIWTWSGWVIGWSVWLVLSYIILVLEKLAGLSWAYWEIPKIGVWLMISLYIIIVGLIYEHKGRSKKSEV
jgi:competence protein ComEC